MLPLTIGGVQHRMSASIGIALGHADPDALLGDRTRRVYRVKADGCGRAEIFH